MARLPALVMTFCLATSAQATLLAYDVTQGIASGPPYPTEVIRFDVFHPNGSTVPPDPVHGLNIQLFNALTQVPPDDGMPLPMTLRGSDDGVGTSPGPVGMINALSTVPPDDGFPAESFFDVFFQVENGGSAGIINADVVPDAGRFFDVFFDVEVNSSAAHQAHFVAPENMAFTNPMIVPNQSASGFHLQFGLMRLNGTPPQELWTMQLTGHYIADVIPEPATAMLGLLSLGALGLRRRR